MATGVYYSAAPEVARIGQRLMQQYHRHLLKTRVEFLFRSKAGTKGGKTTLGTARKVTGLNALLATPDVVDDPEGTSESLTFFVIEVASDMWNYLSEAQRVALVDHELCHCKLGINEKGDIVHSIAAHDVEEFAEIVLRHGLWKPDLSQFIRGVGADQLVIWADNPPEDIWPVFTPDEDEEQPRPKRQRALKAVPDD